MCTIWKKKLKEIFIAYLASLHHKLELIIERVFNTLMEASVVQITRYFKDFHITRATFYNKIWKQNYWRYSSMIYSWIKSIKQCSCQINNQLTPFQPRDDYKELLQLHLLFLGGEKAKDFNIRKSRALHRARWIAKLIYFLNIYLFRSQLQLNNFLVKN